MTPEEAAAWEKARVAPPWAVGERVEARDLDGEWVAGTVTEVGASACAAPSCFCFPFETLLMN